MFTSPEKFLYDYELLQLEVYILKDSCFVKSKTKTTLGLYNIVQSFVVWIHLFDMKSGEFDSLKSSRDTCLILSYDDYAYKLLMVLVKWSRELFIPLKSTIFLN